METRVLKGGCILILTGNLENTGAPKSVIYERPNPHFLLIADMYISARTRHALAQSEGFSHGRLGPLRSTSFSTQGHQLDGYLLRCMAYWIPKN